MNIPEPLDCDQYSKVNLHLAKVLRRRVKEGEGGAIKIHKDKVKCSCCSCSCLCSLSWSCFCPCLLSSALKSYPTPTLAPTSATSPVPAPAFTQEYSENPMERVDMEDSLVVQEGGVKVRNFQLIYFKSCCFITWLCITFYFSADCPRNICSSEYRILVCVCL